VQGSTELLARVLTIQIRFGHRHELTPAGGATYNVDGAGFRRR
jgi:hypothetical protein